MQNASPAVQLETTSGYSLQENGVSERAIRSLSEITQAV